MEAAGTINRIPVDIIRGPYAAAMAVAYTKTVLAVIPAKANFANIPTAPSPVANPPYFIFYGPIIGQKIIAEISI
ncbi:hypothetical protein PoMZ_03347 [Pyricularia oryzae]|uniref:Uncharacterized protein n=1 Tax=Pyricularia oryzae TaxID=318829 RepID=A0A4V1C624_PYROR|nr:hypothetical protein PoMZ_03347 [Pyricularia oryzae]